MSIDKFGRYHNHQQLRGGLENSRGPPGIGFKLTDAGDFNLENKRLINVGVPVDEADATNKIYVDYAIKTNADNIEGVQNTLRNASLKLDEIEKSYDKYSNKLTSLKNNLNTHTKNVNQTVINEIKATQTGLDIKVDDLTKSLEEHIDKYRSFKTHYNNHIKSAENIVLANNKSFIQIAKDMKTVQDEFQNKLVSILENIKAIEEAQSSEKHEHYNKFIEINAKLDQFVERLAQRHNIP